MGKEPILANFLVIVQFRVLGKDITAVLFLIFSS